MPRPHATPPGVMESIQDQIANLEHKLDTLAKLITTLEKTTNPTISLNTKQVAKLTGLTAQFVQDNIRAGRLPARQVSDRRWLISPTDIEPWLDRLDALPHA